MAKVWIVNPYEPLPQEGAVKLRYTRLCEELAARRHAVTWWTVNWAHDRKVHRPQPTGEEPYRIRMLPVPAYRRNISIGRIRSHQVFARTFLREGETAIGKEGKPDLILFSVPPMEVGSAALRLGRLHGVKVVMDVMDAWPDILVETVAPAGPLRALASLLATPYARAMRAYCRRCDGICAQSRTFAEFAVHKGAAEMPAVFYLGADRTPDEFVPMESEDSASRPIEMVYVGSMGAVYDLKTVVRAFGQLDGIPVACRLTIVGEGEQRLELEAFAKESSSAERIRFTGYLQGEEYNAVLASAQIGLIPMHPSSGVAVPYKAGEYLARGMYVINSLPGELQQLLEREECGAFYQAGSVESLSRAMNHAISKLREDKTQSIRQRVKQLFDKQFDRQVISGQFADWLEGLIAKTQ